MMFRRNNGDLGLGDLTIYVFTPLVFSTVLRDSRISELFEKKMVF